MEKWYLYMRNRMAWVLCQIKSIKETLGDGSFLEVSKNLSDVSDTQTSLNNITQVSAATDEYVLTKDTVTGDALFKLNPPSDITKGDTIINAAQGGVLFTDNVNELQQDEQYLSYDPTTSSVGIGNNTPTAIQPNSAAAGGTYLRLEPRTGSTVGILMGNAAGNLGVDFWMKTNTGSIYFDARFGSGSGSNIYFRNGTAGTAVSWMTLGFTLGYIGMHKNTRFEAQMNITQGTDRAYASTMSALINGNTCVIKDVGTGSTINYIPTTGTSTNSWVDGATIILFFEDAGTLTHNAGSVPANTANFLLAGSVNFSAVAGSNITLTLSTVEGVQAWRETSRTTI